MNTTNMTNVTNGIPAIIAASPPPPIATFPTAPIGFAPSPGGNFRAIKPRKSELVAMPDAVVELRSFFEYAATLGKGVPPQADVVQAFDLGSQWAVMRVAAFAWDKYASVQEGIAWTGIRGQMDRLKPAFQLAAAADPTLLTKYPKLAALLGAKKAIAKKGLATKAMNKKAVANGEPPTHGAVGKKRKAAANKAIVTAHAAASAPPPTPVAVTPHPTGTLAALPKADSLTVVVTATPPAAAPLVVNGSNGATHA